MRKLIMTSLFLFVTNLLKGFNPYRTASVDLTKIKLTIWYLQSIKTLRYLFIGLLGAGTCLMLFMAGLILFHLAIVLYAPWGVAFKMGFTLFCAFVYILAAAGLVVYFISEEKWLKIFSAQELMKELAEHPEQEPEKEESGVGSIN